MCSACCSRQHASTAGLSGKVAATVVTSPDAVVVAPRGLQRLAPRAIDRSLPWSPQASSSPLQERPRVLRTNVTLVALNGDAALAELAGRCHRPPWKSRDYHVGERVVSAGAHQRRGAERHAMIDRRYALPITRQAAALGSRRRGIDDTSAPPSDADFARMRRIDARHREMP